MTWQLVAAGVIGGLVGAAARDVLRAIVRSDWVWDRLLAADLRAINRAQRRKVK